MLIDRIKEITAIQSISANEGQMRQYMAEKMQPFC